MPAWLTTKPDELPLKNWKLPGDIGIVSVPTCFVVEFEDDDTLLASVADDLVILRFSSLSFSKKGAGEDECFAQAYVRDKAEEEGHAYYELGERGISTHDTDSEQDGEALVIRYWYIGEKNTMVIVSATMVADDFADPGVCELFEVMPRIIESVRVTKLQKTAEYDGMEVPVTQETFEPGEHPPQQFLSFGESDVAWLEESLDAAAELGRTYGGGGALTPEELDTVFGRWMFDEDEKASDDAIANALGAAFGDYLVSEHGFHWCVVHDEYGTEYAVQHEIGQATAFPRSSVYKRIETQSPECFQNLRVAVLGMLEQLRQENAE